MYIWFIDLRVVKIADKISERMVEVAEALKSLKSAVEADQPTDVVPQDCCMDGVYQENVRFRANVTLPYLDKKGA